MEDTRTVSLPQRHMLQFSISQLKSCPMTEPAEEPKGLQEQSTRLSRMPVSPRSQHPLHEQGVRRRRGACGSAVFPQGKKAPS